MTQFGRALMELNIENLCANTCQAKGRVERANLTLQDRLAKELRLEGIDDKVEVFDFPDGRIEIRHQGKPLPYRIFDKVRHVKQAAIVDNKRP
jgi:hypothetical protein